MQTILLWLRILLTLLVVCFPLFYIARWIVTFFSTTTRKLQQQIDKAKDRIRLEPNQIENDEDNLAENQEDIESAIFTGEENTDTLLPNETEDSKEQLLDDKNTEEIEETEAPTEQKEELPTDTFDHFSAPTEAKQATSHFSAEKLAQTVDDIKYAALTYKERGKKDEYEKKLVE